MRNYKKYIHSGSFHRTVKYRQYSIPLPVPIYNNTNCQKLTGPTKKSIQALGRLIKKGITHPNCINSNKLLYYKFYAYRFSIFLIRINVIFLDFAVHKMEIIFDRVTFENYSLIDFICKLRATEHFYWFYKVYFLVFNV